MTWLDALNLNAEPDPPHSIGTGKRDAIIGTNGKRKPALGKQVPNCEGNVVPRRFQRFAQEDNARGMIGDGQRITPRPVAEQELTLEVSAPHNHWAWCPHHWAWCPPTAGFRYRGAA